MESQVKPIVTVDPWRLESSNVLNYGEHSALGQVIPGETITR